MKQQSTPLQKKFIIWAIVLLFIVAVRYALPPFLLNYTNKILSEMDGYRGHIDGFDFEVAHLGLSVTGFKIERVSKHTMPVPFIFVDEIDTFIDWNSLIHGKVVGRLIIIRPTINFVEGPTKATTQTGTEGDWTTTLKKLKTYTINKVEIREGKMAYSDFHSKPQVKLFINNISASVTNLRAVVDKDKKLPSHAELTGNSIGGGRLTLVANINAIKKIPDFDLNLKFTDINLVALKDFTQAYAGFDFEKGTLSLYGEAAMDSEHIKGYLQPLLEKIKILDYRKDKKEGFFHVIKEAIIGLVFQITKNQTKDRFATKIPFEGDIKDMNVKVFTTILNIFKNEFIKAYPKAIDNTIDIKSVNSKKDKKGK